MSNDPTDSESTHEAFTPDDEDAEYPSTLRITAVPAEQAQTASLDRIERWEQDEEVPHVVNFENRAQLRKLLTDRRMEFLEAVMERAPDSMRALAEQLDRDVHDDLHLLAEYGIIHFRQQGRAKQPYVPYETVCLEVEFGIRSGDHSKSSASA